MVYDSGCQVQQLSQKLFFHYHGIRSYSLLSCYHHNPDIQGDDRSCHVSLQALFLQMAEKLDYCEIRKSKTDKNLSLSFFLSRVTRRPQLPQKPWLSRMPQHSIRPLHLRTGCLVNTPTLGRTTRGPVRSLSTPQPSLSTHPHRHTASHLALTAARLPSQAIAAYK